jgi:hypothetical protein
MSKSKSTTKNTYKKRNTGRGIEGWGKTAGVSFSVWLHLPMGSYAIAHRWNDDPKWDKANDPRDIMVRARKGVYLTRLRKQFLPELGPDVKRDGKGTDYGHRSYCTADQLAKAMARMALVIDSPSFKDHAMDDDLHHAYSRIWSALLPLDDESPYNHATKAWGNSGWWQQPSTAHNPKPSDCMRLGYHWFNLKTGTAYCVDCGAQRVWVKGEGSEKFGHFTYLYPAGAVVLHTKDGRQLAKNQVRRIPGGKVPFDGVGTVTGSSLTDKPTFPGGVESPTTLSPTYTGKGTTGYGLGYPTTSMQQHDPLSFASSGSAMDCLQFTDHWWTNEGTAICRDCGAGRYLDMESGKLRFTHPIGSAMLTDADGEPVDDPHVVTDADMPDEDGSETEATAVTSTELEVYVSST